MSNINTPALFDAIVPAPVLTLSDLVLERPLRVDIDDLRDRWNQVQRRYELEYARRTGRLDSRAGKPMRWNRFMERLRSAQRVEKRFAEHEARVRFALSVGRQATPVFIRHLAWEA